jgi:taurine dioxygenase
VGGDTVFSNMYAAYDALSDRMKGYLDGLDRGARCGHGLWRDHARGDEAAAPQPSGDPHPPGHGAQVHLREPGFTTHIEGIPRSRAARS